MIIAVLVVDLCRKDVSNVNNSDQGVYVRVYGHFAMSEKSG